MPSITATHRAAPATLAAFFAIAGGAWLGFASCGGYLWHAQLVYAVVAMSVLALVLVPRLSSHSLPKRLGLGLAVIALFFLARTLAFPFYIGVQSPTEYFQQASATLWAGPC